MNENEKNNQSDSTYSYRYNNQDNPDMTWRADDYETQQGTKTTNESTSWSAQSGNDTAQQNGTFTNNYTTMNQGKEAEKKRRFSKWADRPKKKPSFSFRGNGRSGNIGSMIGKCVIIAVIFGLVAGGCFAAVTKLTHVADYVVASDENDNKSSSDLGNDSEESSLNTDGTVALTDLSEASGDVSKIAASVMPSIVAITNMGETQIDWFGQTYTQESESSGSGVIISQDDDYLYIATNNHVVESAVTITVTFIDESTATAEVKGTDSASDLAVVSIALDSLSEDTLSSIAVAQIGDSDELSVGDSAVAIGNALGYGQSVTTGVISALDREVTMVDETTQESTTYELIQTDAAINPGNSGGALLNSRGEVIGINSSKYSDTDVEGMGFAIPSAKAEPILNNLITREIVDESESAYLGISGVDVTTEAAEQYNMPEGVYIAKVTSGSAAETAGLQVGDILTQFDGKSITSYEYLQEQMQYYKAGDEVDIVVQRASDGTYQEQKITVTLGSKN
ncbi:S1C family serine protease [Eubacterium oxidoreducens]|uniref:Serine protease Do n=1 Tax=Eubacterium oxidoreducens TaxID=1732 RepID=A0A1G6ADH3_EUBOX|nr:trypsin-like peptidase domain-containing protein [Eubacterium oxidoreducens]SDB06439.1 serine protease Do [Eubacterium oxidoreducens]